MSKHTTRETAAFSVAVFGSCVTRDNFNRTFNPEYKELFDCVALADHVSLVSLMAPPVTVDVEKLDGLSPRLLQKLRREFSRAFLTELRETQPDYLILDFWPDLIFGFADLDGAGVITHNAWSTVKTKFYSDHTVHHFRPDKDRNAFFDRWKDAADDFFEFAAEAIPNTRIVVHSARNVSSWVDRNGSVQDFNPWAMTMNKHWSDMDAYVLEHHSPLRIDVISADTKSFEDHPWGKFPVHYTFDYHGRFLARLSEIALRDVVRKMTQDGYGVAGQRRSVASIKP